MSNMALILAEEIQGLWKVVRPFICTVYIVYIISDICNIFYSCQVNCTTGELIFILITYEHYFIFPF